MQTPYPGAGAEKNFQELFGDTTGPEESFFKFLKPKWNSLDRSDISLPTIPPSYKAEVSDLPPSSTPAWNLTAALQPPHPDRQQHCKGGSSEPGFEVDEDNEEGNIFQKSGLEAVDSLKQPSCMMICSSAFDVVLVASLLLNIS